MRPRQTAAVGACRRVEHEIVRIWRTRMSTEEGFGDLQRECRHPRCHYPFIECACTQRQCRYLR